MDIGAGFGESIKTVIYGGVVGLIFDGRTRPISIPKESHSRLQFLNNWSKAVDEYPN